MKFLIFAQFYASLAQLVEQLIRNEQVVGSSPIGGSKETPVKSWTPKIKNFRRFSLSFINNPHNNTLEHMASF
jgi:hypothetical protein